MKYILLFGILLISIASVSQPTSDSLPRRYRHELGADITGLIKQFLMHSDNGLSSPNPYTPVYYATYRYHLKKSNLRFGIGGAYNRTAVPGYTVNGQEETLFNTFSNFSVRIGYEQTTELSRRWQVFYGIDFRPTFSKEYNETWFTNGGYLNGYKSKTNAFGLAPLLGFRFRLTNRVSLTTELSFSVNYGESSKQNTYKSQDVNLYPVIPDGKKVTSTNISASFNQPTFLTLAVDL